MRCGVGTQRSTVRAGARAAVQTLNEQAQKLFGNEDAVDDMLASLPADTANKYIDTFHAVTDMHRHFDNDVSTIEGPSSAREGGRQGCHTSPRRR